MFSWQLALTGNLEVSIGELTIDSFKEAVKGDIQGKPLDFIMETHLFIKTGESVLSLTVTSTALVIVKESNVSSSGTNTYS